MFLIRFDSDDICVDDTWECLQEIEWSSRNLAYLGFQLFPDLTQKIPAPEYPTK